MSMIKLGVLPGRRSVSTALVALTVLCWAGPAADAADGSSIGCPEASQASPRPADTSTTKVGDAQGTAGFRAYVDPETGELTEPPEDAPPEAPPTAAVRTPDEAPVEKQAPGGGVLTKVPPRFFSPLTATVGPDGEVRMEHAPCPGNSTQRK